MARGREGQAWGWVALSALAVHGVNRALAGDGWSLMWACHVAALLVGVGLVSGRRVVAQVGVLWLCLGNLMWWTDLLTGGELKLTSALTHLGGIACGLWGLKQMGGWQPVRLLWLRALISGQALVLISRAVTPPAENVNLAFYVHEASTTWFNSFEVYHVVLGCFGGVTFWVGDQVLRRQLGVASGG
jgi:hypothetical protein